MKAHISMIPRKGIGKTSNSVYLVFLLLLSCVELNSGPGDPRDILRAKSATLTNAISNNLDKVVVSLNAKGLVPQQAVEESSIAAYSNYKKASILVTTLQSQLSSSNDRRQYLIEVCNVLKDKDLGDETLATHANDMLKELGGTQPGQMNGHANGRTSNERAGTLYTSSQSTLSIKDLREVLNDLRDGGFSDGSYYDLGLELGLHDRTLDNIRSDNSNAKDSLRECISKWLKRVDDVNGHGGANWKTLCDAVEKINGAAAEYIRNRKKMHSQPNEQGSNEVRPPTTTMKETDNPRLSSSNPSISNPSSSDRNIHSLDEWYAKLVIICLVVLILIEVVLLMVLFDIWKPKSSSATTENDNRTKSKPNPSSNSTKEESQVFDGGSNNLSPNSNLSSNASSSGEHWDKKTVGAIIGLILIGVMIVALVGYLVFYWYSTQGLKIYGLVLLGVIFLSFLVLIEKRGCWKHILRIIVFGAFIAVFIEVAMTWINGGDVTKVQLLEALGSSVIFKPVVELILKTLV